MEFFFVARQPFLKDTSLYICKSIKLFKIKLKIISLHKKEATLVREAKKENRDAQQRLFELYSPKMLGVCRQYVKDMHHAEDLMLQGFFKVFTNIKKFKEEGSLEGWIRRIMINTCISYLRKKKFVVFPDDDYVLTEFQTESVENTAVEDLQMLIDQLPDGYKLVFNLYAIEGYKHAEIAKKLKISESTSKSQLFKARKWLQTSYQKMNQVKHVNK